LASGGPALSNNQLIAGILLAVVHKEQLAGSSGERVGVGVGSCWRAPGTFLCCCTTQVHPSPPGQTFNRLLTLGHTTQGIEQTGPMQTRAAELCQTVI